jgi:hypothetical protein
MSNNQAPAVSKMLCLALAISFISGMAQAQQDLSAFTGKFTLTNQVLWGDTLLQPGNYTLTIGSSRMPAFVLISDGKGRPVARFMSGIDGGRTRGGNALLISQKAGQLRVYSLALASLGRVLVYDPALAREMVLEARANQTVPVTLAKR